jgi:hypothetical protein
VYTRKGDDGPGARCHFCAHCGATVYYELLGIAGFLGIPVGAFADPAFPSPTVSVYEDRTQSTFRERVGSAASEESRIPIDVLIDPIASIPLTDSQISLPRGGMALLLKNCT